MTLTELMKRDRMRHRNHIRTNVNSDRDKAVVVEAPMMGLLVSGLVWLKSKTKEDKGLFPNYKNLSKC